MNAQTVWLTWRRIMCEQPLAEAVLAGRVDDLQQRFSLTDDEYAVAREYAHESSGARWFVENYRFRMRNSFLNALENGAPLTLRALLADGHDVRELGARFLDTVGWRDYGPFVYTYCAEALTFLRHDAQAVRVAGMSDLMGLEAAAVAMLLRVGALDEATRAQALGSTAASAAQFDDASVVWVRSPYCELYRSSTQLAKWLREKGTLGREPLPAVPGVYVAYYADDVRTHRFGMLPERAAQIVDALEHEADRAALNERLVARGMAPVTEADARAFELLRQCRAIDVSRG
ncbi:hypothetical protein D7S89_08050 [Trinickia fusca]|uniref:DUF2063 domain-containing protein n=2 Tax=Trinickia fusca TaxID=2419777 RepID=A0A494XQD3_9BURK|nr:hypothetical protein D7S89_08050 [Trinickia fusca]